MCAVCDVERADDVTEQGPDADAPLCWYCARPVEASVCHGCGVKWEGESEAPLYCDRCAEDRARDEAAEQTHDLWNDQR